jgi:hypothetical protein
VVDAGPLLARAYVNGAHGNGARAGLAAAARLPGAQVVMVSRDLVVLRLSAQGGPP